MSVMILKPSQEVAGSGSAGREKAGGTPGDRARVGAVLTPLPSTTCRVISFLRIQKVPGRRNGGERRLLRVATMSAQSLRRNSLAETLAWLPPTEEKQGLHMATVWGLKAS